MDDIVAPTITFTATGDVTGSDSGTTSIDPVLTIGNNVVTYAKMQDVTATSRFIGRITSGAGDPEELTGTQATTLLDTFTSGLKGLAPASGGGTSNFLRADGTWAAPVGGSPLLPVTGTGTATGGVIGELDGNILNIQNGGENFLQIDPTAGAESSILQAYNITNNDNISLVGLGTTNTEASFVLNANFNAGENQVGITGVADGSVATITYNAFTHLLTGAVVMSGLGGSGVGVVAVDNDGLLSWGAASSGATWGSITGTLSSQTDLQTALDAKLAHTTANPTHTGTTPSGTGVIGATMFARTTSTHSLADNTTEQVAFPSSMDTWTLQGNTTYKFKMRLDVEMGTTSHTTNIGFTLGGGASLTSIVYDVLSLSPTNAGAQYGNIYKVATASVASLFNSNPSIVIKVEGEIRMNAGGTITPFIKFSNTPGGTNQVMSGSFIEFTPIGTGTQNSQGNVG